MRVTCAGAFLILAPCRRSAHAASPSSAARRTSRRTFSASPKAGSFRSWSPFRGRDVPACARRARLRRPARDRRLPARGAAGRAIDGIDPPVLSVIAEPPPRADHDPRPNYVFNLAELQGIDRDNIDRVIVADPDGRAPPRRWCRCRQCHFPSTTASFARHARPAASAAHDLRRPFDTHREKSLIGLKHDFDLPHSAHGLIGPELDEVLDSATWRSTSTASAGSARSRLHLDHLAAGTW